MTHTQWMQYALQLAKVAETHNEVPVGAVIIANNRIIGSAHNQTLSQNNACAHAEMLALEQAFLTQCNYRLEKATLYVTLEPCCMCAGALIHARIDTVVFGAYDKRVGACGSVFNILGDPRQYHQPKIIGHCLKEESEALLKQFFAKRRGLMSSQH